jgi:predicted dienelactone hydrolase
MGVWDSVGMAGLSVPALIIAGSADAISGYENGMRLIFDEATATERHLLTFQNAGHNAAAPIPAPLESWRPSPHLDFAPFEHYADAVWDTVRMNNIAQHFVTAFLDVHLKGETDKAQYLDGRFAGFAEGTARGLRWEIKGRGA